METIQVNRIFSIYNIDEDRYQTIIFLAHKELSLYTNLSKLYMGKNFLLKRALELIRVINNTTSETYNKVIGSLPNLDYRINNTIKTNLEKQLFINNFMFNNEQFIKVLKNNSIKLEDIENINNCIKEQKKISKESNDYSLDIDSIYNLEPICKYYNFNNKEIIINKILELYNLQYDLLKSGLSQKLR